MKNRITTDLSAKIMIGWAAYGSLTLISALQNTSNGALFTVYLSFVLVLGLIGYAAYQLVHLLLALVLVWCLIQHFRRDSAPPSSVL